MSLRDDILKAHEACPKSPIPVSVPEWGGITVYVRVMNGLERDKYETARVKETGSYRARFFSYVTCDEHGNPIFSEADFATLNQFNANAMDRVIEVAMKINAVTKEAMEEVGEALPTAP